MQKAEVAVGVRPRLLPLIAAQFFDGAGGRFSGLLLGLWAAKAAGLSGFSRYTTAGLAGIAAAALLVGPLTRRLSGRATMRTAVSGLVGSRLGSYSAVAWGLGLEVLFVFTFIGAMCGTVMVNAAKVFVPADERAPVTFAWIGLAGSVGSAIGAGAAGLVIAWAPPWLLVALGLPVAIASLIPMLRLARTATGGPDPTVKRSPLRPVLARSASTLALTTVIGATTAGFALLRDGIVAELYSTRWVGMIAISALLGDLLATQVVPRLGTLPRGRRQDLLLWPFLAAVGAASWAFANNGIWWMLVAQCVAGLCGALRGSLAEGRLLQVAGRDHILVVSSVRDAIGAGVGALMITLTPSMIAQLGYEGTAAATVSILAAIALFGSGMQRLARRSGLGEHRAAV